MVFVRGHVINLERPLEGVGPELRNVVGELVAGIERRIDDITGRITEPAGRNLVVQEPCAGSGIGAGSRIEELLRRIVADAASKAGCAECGKISAPLGQCNGL